MSESATTVTRILAASAARHAHRPALRVQRNGAWVRWTHAEAAAAVERLAARLHLLGLRAGDRVGLWSANCPEWTLCDLALMRLGVLPVPLYVSSSAAVAREILADAQADWLLVGGARPVELARQLADAPGGPRLVLMDGQATREGELALASLLAGDGEGELEAARREVAEAEARRGPDDLCTLIYTSGTSGEPKGVMLSHGNLLHQYETVNRFFTIDESDISLCFLPLSHVFERAWSTYVLSRGAEVVYLEDPLQAASLLREVRPTTLCSVPRLFEKIRSAVLEKVEAAPPLRRRLFHWAMETGRRAGWAAVEGRRLAWPRRLALALADRLVLGKLRDAVGGPKKLLVSGGAALDSVVEEFFFAAGLLVMRGVRSDGDVAPW
jgi:long-chain acyl-CoA synthetase